MTRWQDENSNSDYAELSVKQSAGCVVLIIVMGCSLIEVVRHQVITLDTIIALTFVIAAIWCFVNMIIWFGNLPDRTEMIFNRIPSHARIAFENTRLPVGAAGYIPRNLGFVVYEQRQGQPKLHHVIPIPITADYIQPFVELGFDNPVRHTVRFLLTDSSGVVRLDTESEFTADAGRRAILALARLPVTGNDAIREGDEWTLTIKRGSMPIAEHYFKWYDPHDFRSVLANSITSDGELTPDLAALIEDRRLKPMSLDDLLGGDSSRDVR